MYQRDDLDFINASKVVNLPNPINGTDLSNKYYIDTIAPVASHFASYTLPAPAVISNATTTMADLTGFSLMTTTYPETLEYFIYLNICFNKTVAGTLAIYNLLINNIIVDARREEQYTGTIRRFTSYKFKKTIAPNTNVKIQFASSTNGSIVNVRSEVEIPPSIPNALSSLTIVGFKQSNYIP